MATYRRIVIVMLKKASLLLLVFGLLAASCADDSSSDGEDAADGGAATEEEAATDESATSSSAPTAEEDPDTATGDAAVAGEATLGDVFTDIGVEPSQEAIDCLQSRGFELTDASADPSRQIEGSIAAMVCAGDQLAPVLVAESPIEGLDDAKAECMVTEIFQYLGTLPTEEAMLFFGAPENIEDAVTPALTDNCDATPEEIAAVLEVSA